MRLRKLVCDSGSSGTAGSVSDTSARQHVGSVFFLRTCEGRKLDGLGNGLLCPGLGSLIAKEFGNLL